MGLEKLKLSRSAKESKKSKQEAKSSTKSSKTEQKTVVVPEIVTPATIVKSRRRRSASHPNLAQGNLSHTLRSRRSTFHKIVETADIISQLAKNTKSSSAKIKKPIQPVSTLDATNKVHKFKTSGLVATAVVHPRKYRKSLTLQTPMPLQTTSPSLRVNESDSEQENVKIPLKRATKKSLRLFKESASRKLEKTS